VRLLLRKPGRWHTKASMETFTKEVGQEGLHRALTDLCIPLTTPVKPEEKPEISVKEEPEIIDLTFDSDDEEDHVNNAEAGPSRLGGTFSVGTSLINTKPGLDSISDDFGVNLSDPDIDFFCRDQTTMTLHEVLNRLGAEELRVLVKSTKVKPRKLVVRILAWYLYSSFNILYRRTR
jgi:fanconi-associated nuclease 1